MGSSHCPKALGFGFWKQISMLFNPQILTTLVPTSAADTTLAMKKSIFAKRLPYFEM